MRDRKYASPLLGAYALPPSPGYHSGLGFWTTRPKVTVEGIDGAKIVRIVHQSDNIILDQLLDVGVRYWQYCV